MESGIGSNCQRPGHNKGGLDHFELTEAYATIRCTIIKKGAYKNRREELSSRQADHIKGNGLHSTKLARPTMAGNTGLSDLVISVLGGKLRTMVRGPMPFLTTTMASASRLHSGELCRI